MKTHRRLCPYVERADFRCASRLTLGGIHETFRLCAGDALLCPVYHEIRREELLRSTEPHLAHTA